MKVNYISAIMGAGKTTAMFEKMREWKESGKYDQFVYISPLLSEVGGTIEDEKPREGRIQQALPEMNFKYPLGEEGKTKTKSAVDLLESGENLASTHQLFEHFSRASVAKLKERKAVLIIDEALDSIKRMHDIKSFSIDMLIHFGHITVCPDTGLVTPVKDKFSLKKYPDIEPHFKQLLKLSSMGFIYLIGKDLFLWEFSKDVLSAFTDVYVMTYFIDGTYFSPWCKKQGIELVEYTDINLHRSTEEVKKMARENIVLDDFSSLAKMDVPFSQDWYAKAKMADIDKITKCLNSYRASRGMKGSELLFTCPKAVVPDRGTNTKTQKKIRSILFNEKNWLYSGCKATNDYADKSVLVYLLSKNPDPKIKRFLKPFSVHHELYSLHSMVQWIWRGCIRKGEPMRLLIACPKMKALFVEWLNTTDEEIISRYKK